VTGQDVKISPELVDRMIEVYCDWRTGCGEVQAAYDRFRGASSSDRGAAFAAYTAALDREQAACESYAEQVRLIQACFARAEQRRIAGKWTGISVLSPRRRLRPPRTVATPDVLGAFDAIEDPRTS
jgi:hypothetical protein